MNIIIHEQKKVGHNKPAGRDILEITFSPESGEPTAAMASWGAVIDLDEKTVVVNNPSAAIDLIGSEKDANSIAIVMDGEIDPYGATVTAEFFNDQLACDKFGDHGVGFQFSFFDSPFLPVMMRINPVVRGGNKQNAVIITGPDSGKTLFVRDSKPVIFERR